MSGYQYQSVLKRISAIIFIFVSIWWGLYSVSPPAPKPADAPATEFSAQRAFQHVESIAQRPHMVGTAAHDSARSYIMEQLRQLGLSPQISKGISTSGYRGLRAVQTQNIITRLEGSDPQKTIMLLAHYDSVPYAPGAADDASGVAAILEIIRAIKAGEPLLHDILILLSDGEEMGLLGARYFAEHNPLRKDVDLVINLEARGTSGSSIMFETNTGNAELIPHFANAAEHPVANSLTYSIYKILPNDTDFSVFKPYDIQGLNFAYIEDYLDYHTMQDNPENLSLYSLQHHGNNTLEVLRRMGHQNFDLSSDSDMAYFNNPLGGLTYYPQSWAPWLAGFTILLFLFAKFVGFRRQQITFKNSLIGFGVYLGSIITTALLAWFGWDLIRQWIFPQYQWLQQGETYARGWYLWFFLLLASLIVIPAYRWIKYKINNSNLLVGIYLTWTILLITLTVFLPASNYMLVWPAAFGLIGWILTGDRLESGEFKWRTLALLSASVFMVLFMFPFYIKLIHIALSTRMIAASLLLFILMLGLIWPLLDYIVERAPLYFYGLLGAAVLFCFAGAALNSNYTPEQKKQNSLIYASDLDNGKSYWLSLDHTTDDWTRQFLGTQPADSAFSNYEVFSSNNILYAPAPAMDIDSPQIEVLQDSIGAADSLRHLYLRFTKTYPANATTISFSNSQYIAVAQLDSEIIYSESNPLQDQRESFSRASYFQDASEPFTLRLSLRMMPDTASFQIKTVSYNLNLPDSLMRQYPPRPANAMPKSRGFTNGTIWKTTVSLDELK